jgi:RND family efflux transporter MFP subunit
MKISKWAFLTICLVLLAATACSRKDSKRAGNNGKADSTGTNGVAKKENNPADLKAVPVEVTTISGGEISSYVLTNASIETEEAVDIFPQVSGIVVKLRAEEGQYVQKGAVLLDIDEREYKLKEEAARVNYERQKNSFERSKNMFEKKLLSESEFEVANFNLEQARIEWEQARLTLDYCKIKAPISGFISERMCKLGDRLLTSTKVYSIVNPDLLLAKIHLTEKDALRTKVGQRAEIISEALPGQRFAGEVDRISPVVDPSSGMVRVTISVSDRQRLLKPGMFVNVHLITETKRNAVLIPKKAVVYDDNRQFVYAVRNDTLALKVPLKPGYADRDNIEALEGIGIGDTIIVVGHSGMKDSTRVKIAEMKN